ncbi:MAG: rubredoxin [Proteobacteria bacterium]|nr:rubredoxin [Pseudomonadota bacterium]
MARFRCPDCGYVYDEARGDPREGYAPGVAFAALPDSFVCPDCSVRDKADFVADEAPAHPIAAMPGTPPRA